jgi:hypothetical protein
MREEKIKKLTWLERAGNADCWAIGRYEGRRFHVRRIVWGRLLARAEKDPDEKIKRAVVLLQDQVPKKN